VSEYISPDGVWKIVFQRDEFHWVDMSKELTGNVAQFTIRELVEATKNIAPELWKE
jgi:hypothetical protein